MPLAARLLPAITTAQAGQRAPTCAAIMPASASRENSVPAMKVCLVDHAASDGEAHAATPSRLSARPAALLQQSDLGIRALRQDLHELPGVTLLELGAVGPFWRRFDDAVRAADAVWLLAPTAGGLLERLSRHVLRRQRLLLGSRPAALRTCASVVRSARLLASAGVAVACVHTPGKRLLPEFGAWMVRPDDGTAWFDTHLFDSGMAALAWRAAAAAQHRGTPYVLQQFVAGAPASLALLCCAGKAQLLACSSMRLAIRGQQFHLLGATINDLPDPLGVFEGLAQAVAAALPGLWGLVNVDLIVTDHGPVVLNVGPLPGFAYAGLRASLRCNLAALALDLIAHPLAPGPRPPATAISVDTGAID